MQNVQQLCDAINSGRFDGVFSKLYRSTADAHQRYCSAAAEFEKIFGDGEARIFSAPGRTEIGGNHTDHQHGCVLAGSVDLDIIAVARKTDTNIIRVQSAGFPVDIIDLGALTPQDSETEHAASLIRGIAARFNQLGYRIGGFDAYTTSNVLKGSGLSSSAAFEVMICTLLNTLYNDERMDAVEKAIISQYSENNFFGKPCGLMDQMACSVGGFTAIDFADPAKPVIEKIDFDFASTGHSLCIVDTGGCHADLTDEYAAIPAEMKLIAAYFGKKVLREVDENEFYAALADLRQKYSDRAVLRAMHFFSDNRRAVELKDALKAGDFSAFCRISTESGISSLSCLQNVFAAFNPSEQGLSVALALTGRILGSRGAYRVHGGGFAGTIQAFVPDELLDTYKSQIEAVFGEGHCYVLSIRPLGGIEIR